MVVLNTTGNGVTPSTDTIQTNWDGYSFALIARGNGVSSFAEARAAPAEISNPHIPPAWLPLGTTPQQFSYNLNNNGTGTEFSILAQQIGLFDARRLAPSRAPARRSSGRSTPSRRRRYRVDSGPFSIRWAPAARSTRNSFRRSLHARDASTTRTTRYSQTPDPAAQIVSIEICEQPSEAAALLHVALCTNHPSNALTTSATAPSPDPSRQRRLLQRLPAATPKNKASDRMRGQPVAVLGATADSQTLVARISRSSPPLFGKAKLCNSPPWRPKNRSCAFAPQDLHFAKLADAASECSLLESLDNSKKLRRERIGCADVEEAAAGPAMEAQNVSRGATTM